MTQMRKSRCREEALAGDHVASGQWSCDWTPSLAHSRVFALTPTPDSPPSAYPQAPLTCSV